MYQATSRRLHTHPAISYTLAKTQRTAHSTPPSLAHQPRSPRPPIASDLAPDLLCIPCSLANNIPPLPCGSDLLSTQMVPEPPGLCTACQMSWTLATNPIPVLLPLASSPRICQPTSHPSPPYPNTHSAFPIPTRDSPLLIAWPRTPLTSRRILTGVPTQTRALPIPASVAGPAPSSRSAFTPSHTSRSPHAKPPPPSRHPLPPRQQTQESHLHHPPSTTRPHHPSSPFASSIAAIALSLPWLPIQQHPRPRPSPPLFPLRSPSWRFRGRHPLPTPLVPSPTPGIPRPWYSTPGHSPTVLSNCRPCSASHFQAPH
jgi:hypothetical protein